MTRRNAKVGSPELDAATLVVLREANMPVSIQYVADHVNIAWHQARAQLFKMAMEGKIKGIDTTKSWIFTLDTDTEIPGVKPVSAPNALNSHPNSAVTSSITDTQTKGDKKNEPTNQ